MAEDTRTMAIEIEMYDPDAPEGIREEVLVARIWWQETDPTTGERKGERTPLQSFYAMRIARLRKPWVARVITTFDPKQRAFEDGVHSEATYDGLKEYVDGALGLALAYYQGRITV